MRTRLLVPVMFAFSFLRAQTWCPPGATWTYDSDGFVGLHGYTVMTYVGDTLLGGESGQLITAVTVGVNIDQQIDTLIYPGASVTSHIGDLVYVWSDPQQSWDTLYDFSAGPGDSWAPPHSTPICGGAEYGDQVMVLDSGTVQIDGMLLHYLDIHNGFYYGRITERLGWSVGMFIMEGCWAQECYCDLRCYHDVELDYARPGFTSACDAISMGSEEVGVGSAEVFPNPGTDHFTLALPPGTHTITLADATGRLVLQRSVSGDRMIFDTGQLPAGIYSVRVDQDGRPFHWVKE